MWSEKSKSQNFRYSLICIKHKQKNNILIMLIFDEIVFISNGVINTKFKNVVSSGEK